jgi:hypothetical protein
LPADRDYFKYSFFKRKTNHKGKNARLSFGETNSGASLAAGCRDAGGVGLSVFVLDP